MNNVIINRLLFYKRGNIYKVTYIRIAARAFDSASSTTSLLRKAYVVAKKLKITEFEKWLTAELNGYDCDIEQIPQYRNITGDVKGWNPYHGWVPVIIKNTKVAEILTNNKIAQPISEIEILAKSDNSTLTMKYHQKTQNELSRITRFSTNFEMHFCKSQAENILEVVRNIVLEWALKLEEDGIIGEGMSFTNEEKAVASQ